MPVFTDDDAPPEPRFAGLATESFNVAEKSADSLLESCLVSRTGKVRFQSVPLQDDAGRTLLHEKVRHGVKFPSADFERKVKPRLLHKVLCHSTTK